jgi:cytochrome c oxidase subunit 2
LIAGGVLSNNPENLATWLNDPQAVKPGNDMVLPEKLNSTQIDELVQYLESLK